MLGNFIQPIWAKTIAFEEAKCSVEIPDDWSVKRNTSNQLSAVSIDRQQSIQLGIDPIQAQAWEDTMSSGFDLAATQHGWSIDARNNILIQAVPFYMIECSRPSQSGTDHCKSMSGIANNLQYTLIAINHSNDSQADNSLKAILDSFHFLGEPKFSEGNQSTPSLQISILNLWFRFYTDTPWFISVPITLVVLVGALLCILRLFRTQRRS